MNMATTTCFFRRILFMASRNYCSRSEPIRGIIFDMDGTLTLPVLDFQGLRNKLGMDKSMDILEFASTHPPDQRDKIYEMIEQWEAEGIANMKLRPHLHAMLSSLKQSNVHVALLTRNNQHAVDAFLRKLLSDDADNVFKNKSEDVFSVVLTRDFLPYKPHPAPALHICSEWGVSPENVVLVGDDVQDIECGRRAGTVTTLVNKPGKNEKVRETADFSIDCLSEITELLKDNFSEYRTRPASESEHS